MFAWKMDDADPDAAMEKEARRMKPLIRRYLEWRYGPTRWQDPEPRADADWAPPSRHWRVRALLAWLLNLLILAVWSVVFAYLDMHMAGYGRWDDPYLYATTAWCALPLFYAAGQARDRRKRLKPSAFFFWFDRCAGGETTQPKARRTDRSVNDARKRRPNRGGEPMQSQSHALARIKEQLAEQSSQFRDVCAVLEGLDPRALLPVSEQLLHQFDAACSERVAVASAAPVRGLRA